MVRVVLAGRFTSSGVLFVVGDRRGIRLSTMIPTTTIRARFDGHVLVPEGPVDLPVDRLLDVEVRDPGAAADAASAHSPAMIVRGLQALTPIPEEDAVAFRRVLREEKRPADFDGIFGDNETQDGGAGGGTAAAGGA